LLIFREIAESEEFTFQFQISDSVIQALGFIYFARMSARDKKGQLKRTAPGRGVKLFWRKATP
jgi:hypothetical protein